MREDPLNQFKGNHDFRRQETTRTAQPSPRDDNPAGTFSVHWPSGRIMIFHYAFLLDIEFNPEGEMQTITFEFTNRTLTLHGFGFKKLIEEFANHIPARLVVCRDRYVSLSRKVILLNAVYTTVERGN